MTLSIPPSTIPNSWTQLTSETKGLGFDTTQAFIDAGTVGPPTLPSCVLTNLTTGDPVDLADEPTIEGNKIIQIVRGPTQLVAQNRYMLAVTFTVAEDDIQTMLLALVVPL